MCVDVKEVNVKRETTVTQSCNRNSKGGHGKEQ